LTVEQRIALFLDVLSAVAHAHANLIVHRDLKPANVLVSSSGEVKLLDFGIARLLADEAGSATALQLSNEGGSAMTPLYAAPEQLTGGAITTATDVYALGVLLYVLLTGQHPIGAGPRSLAEVINAVTETEPRKPSEAMAIAGGPASADRAARLDRLSRMLRGDLDNIVLKALKKQPRERYGSVVEMADDLRRFLTHQPVAARPDTVSYRARMYIRRHRPGVAIAAMLVLLLTGFAIMQAVQLRRIARERDRADRIAGFMTDMFKGADPAHKLGSTVTAREVLDNAASNIDAHLSRDPELQARLMYVMAMAYNNLGLFSRAQVLLEKSIERFTAALGPNDIQTLTSRQRLAWSYYQQGRLAEAEAQQRSLIETERKARGPAHDAMIGTMGDLATTLSDERRLPESEKIQREVLEDQKRTLGPEAPYTLSSMSNLAVTLLYEGRVKEAEQLERETLEIQLRAHGRENLSTIHYMINEAEFTAALGELDKAEKMSLELLDLERRIIGPDSPEGAETMYSLAVIKMKQGKVDDAFALLRQAVDHGLLPRAALGMSSDPDLQPLHADARFDALISYAKDAVQRRAPAQSRP
jgi:tetratricopeptide (TPR) repeat protein